MVIYKKRTGEIYEDFQKVTARARRDETEKSEFETMDGAR